MPASQPASHACLCDEIWFTSIHKPSNLHAHAYTWVAPDYMCNTWTGCLKPGLLYRAALEGATLALLAGLRRMVAAGLAPSEVRLVGGGSRSALWRQVVADAFQLPVRCGGGCVVAVVVS